MGPRLLHTHTPIHNETKAETNQLTDTLLKKKTGQGIIGNMRICPGPYLLENSAGLHLSGAGSTEWQALAIKRYGIGRGKVIKGGDVGTLEI